MQRISWLCTSLLQRRRCCRLRLAQRAGLLHAVGNVVDVAAVRARRAVAHLLQAVGRVAHLDGVPPVARVRARRRAPVVVGAAVGTALGLGLAVERRRRRQRGRGRVRRAKGQVGAVLRQVLARGAAGARADKLPVAVNVADLDARAVGQARVGAKGALAALGVGGHGGHGRGGNGEEGSRVLHFGGVVGKDE
ncbi:uncharacterized protein SPSK_09883 [Sporothrix schenckii 1099-18]|uniref:Uncharacterized protein n=1 Tax=Sporothrix schenckii 1099-18 TaxID=1397361 RepID=A0A0F2M5Y3_SPOSC|nr:uncharacterized protein SPSK_09883 [Sporothrix schenckii 1099-18]KJR84215.1 hypothetical protein SPSK_09883 [Sporothrix schenckii 1099-18]